MKCPMCFGDKVLFRNSEIWGTMRVQCVNCKGTGTLPQPDLENNLEAKSGTQAIAGLDMVVPGASKAEAINTARPADAGSNPAASNNLEAQAPSNTVPLKGPAEALFDRYNKAVCQFPIWKELKSEDRNMWITFAAMHDMLYAPVAASTVSEKEGDAQMNPNPHINGAIDLTTAASSTLRHGQPDYEGWKCSCGVYHATGTVCGVCGDRVCLTLGAQPTNEASLPRVEGRALDRFEDYYVAWICFSNGGIHICDSDTDKAFKVWRKGPIQEYAQAVADHAIKPYDDAVTSYHQRWADIVVKLAQERETSRKLYAALKYGYAFEYENEEEIKEALSAFEKGHKA